MTPSEVERFACLANEVSSHSKVVALRDVFIIIERAERAAMERAAKIADAQVAVYEAKIGRAVDRDDSAARDRAECYKDAVENIATTIRAAAN